MDFDRDDPPIVELELELVPNPEHEAVPGVETERAEAKDRHPSGRRVRWERPTRIAVASLSLIAIMFLFVFPTRSYLAQQREVNAARRAVEVLRSQNEEMARDVRLLQTPSEIERMARVQFNMVFRGEEAYNVISPAKSAPIATPSP